MNVYLLTAVFLAVPNVDQQYINPFSRHQASFDKEIISYKEIITQYKVTFSFQ